MRFCCGCSQSNGKLSEGHPDSGPGAAGLSGTTGGSFRRKRGLRGPTPCSRSISPCQPFAGSASWRMQALRDPLVSCMRESIGSALVQARMSKVDKSRNAGVCSGRWDIGQERRGVGRYARECEPSHEAMTSKRRSEGEHRGSLPRVLESKESHPPSSCSDCRFEMELRRSPHGRSAIAGGASGKLPLRSGPARHRIRMLSS